MVRVWAVNPKYAIKKGVIKRKCTFLEKNEGEEAKKKEKLLKFMDNKILICLFLNLWKLTKNIFIFKINFFKEIIKNSNLIGQIILKKEL